MEPILKIENLHTEITTNYGKFEAVSGVSFELGKGETLGLVGESGCGKSLTSLSITRLLGPKVKVSQGKAIFEGKDIFEYSEREMRELRGGSISMIFQEPMTALNPIISIEKQMIEMIIPHLKVSKKEAKDIALRLLEEMGIERANQVMKGYPFQMSGGMLQRIMIAMSLSCNPKILIADEPTTALDVTIQAQILKLLNELKKKHEISMILISHNIGVVAQVCDRVAVMYYGKIVEMAPVEALFNQTLHPYTKGLFECIPKLEGEVRLLKTIQGVVPAISEEIAGCAFASRCSFCMDICRKQEPELVEVYKNHYCRCFKITGGIV